MSSADEKTVIAKVHPPLLIGGQWPDGEGARPAGTIRVEVADATVADGKAALDAAVAAQADWARTAPRDRGEILRSAFELIRSRADQFASLMSLEMGKTL